MLAYSCAGQAKRPRRALLVKSLQMPLALYFQAHATPPPSNQGYPVQHKQQQEEHERQSRQQLTGTVGEYCEYVPCFWLDFKYTSAIKNAPKCAFVTAGQLQGEVEGQGWAGWCRAVEATKAEPLCRNPSPNPAPTCCQVKTLPDTPLPTKHKDAARAI